MRLLDNESAQKLAEFEIKKTRTYIITFQQ